MLYIPMLAVRAVLGTFIWTVDKIDESIGESLLVLLLGMLFSALFGLIFALIMTHGQSGAERDAFTLHATILSASVDVVVYLMAAICVAYRVFLREYEQSFRILKDEE